MHQNDHAHTAGEAGLDRMNLNNKRFRLKQKGKDSPSANTVFQYQQEGSAIRGVFCGGGISNGFILGRKVSETEVELLHQYITTDKQLIAGESRGLIWINEDGLLEIQFTWKWTKGAECPDQIDHYVEEYRNRNSNN